MYTLKSIVRRGTPLVALFAIVAAAVMPASAAFADALNPLTDRSLTLSSSSPGWSFTDGSGNTTYAAPNSGANGKQTGETFTFKVSTDSSATGTNTPVKAFSFQYCTTSAGFCNGPTGTDGSNSADLDVVTASPSEISSPTWDIIKPGGTGRTEVQGSIYNGLPKMDNSEGNFAVLMGGAYSGGWVMGTDTQEDGSSPTGKKNFITLVNTTGIQPTAGTEIKVIFFGTNTNYITNPGAGAFFVKINDYTTYDDTTTAPVTTVDAGDIVDGGVTVANVMNQSIEIQTKVLETMDFSVGTVDPYTLDATQLQASSLAKSVHAPCDRILTGMTPASAVNVLQMGNETGENSLETDKTYSTHSYWRLSSNSSAGATVYYSGVTLSNTVGDQINAIGATAAQPAPGSEQFGLALDNETTGNFDVNYNTERKIVTGTPNVPYLYENGADNSASGLADPVNADVDASTTTDVGSNGSYHHPQLYPLTAHGNYDDGAGNVNLNYAGGTNARDTEFAFDPSSNTVPVPIADESSQVVDCVTGKMRYIANIAATTPAGIYTTKVNYIAAPQY
jgi:hypothetical protein